MQSTTSKPADSAGRHVPSGRLPGWTERDWLFLALVLLIGTVSFLPGLGSASIIDSSEGYYSEASREMYELGDYITPHLNYQTWFEKPILTYWLVSASYHALGVNEFAARLPGALCAILTAGLLFVFCRRVLSRRAAFLSALVLLSL